MCRCFREMRQIKSEFNSKCIGCLTHFNSLDLSLGLWARCELKTLKFAEHIHITLELEFRCFDNIFLAFCDLFSLKGHAHFTVFLLNLTSLVLILHVSLQTELVIVWFKFNPFACLLSDHHHTLLECELTLTEHFDISLLILVGKRLQFFLVQLVAFRLEMTG